MKRIRSKDIDGGGPPPFTVLLGEWWEDRKRELAEMNGAACEAVLRELGLPVPPTDYERPVLYTMADRLLWMRKRIAYAEQIAFHLERGQAVPASMTERALRMDARPGYISSWSVNIFYDVDGEGKEKRALAAQNRRIEEAIARDIAPPLQENT